MGISIASLEYLSAKGLLRAGSRILDIGSQNLYHATPDMVRAFAKRHGLKADPELLEREAQRISYFSTPRPGERTSYLSELLDLTEIQYESYDVCPALKSEIFDLNVERLPARYRNAFDVVLNFGTTEHLINQLNAFEVMHEAIKVGGVAYHQIPSVGWIDHGYFNYNALLLDDLATANGYEVVDRFFTPGGISDFSKAGVDVRDPNDPARKSSSANIPEQILNFNLNYVLRKVADEPFYVGLEIATTHAPLSAEMAAVYGKERKLAAGEAIRQRARNEHSQPVSPRLREHSGWDLLHELGFRIRRRLGLARD